VKRHKKQVTFWKRDMLLYCKCHRLIDPIFKKREFVLNVAFRNPCFLVRHSLLVCINQESAATKLGVQGHLQWGGQEDSVPSVTITV